MLTDKRKIVSIIAAAAMATFAMASSWEGSAMVGSYGEFPSSGYYAACNSFERNTSVEITNLDNGRRITVIVTGGLSDSGIFMVLSVNAAEALGLTAGRLGRIRASEPRSAVELTPSAGSGAAVDPDLNPRILAASELKRMGYELVPTPGGSTVQPVVSPQRVPPESASTTAQATLPAVEPVPPAAGDTVAARSPETGSTAESTAGTPAAPDALDLASPEPRAAPTVAPAPDEPVPVRDERPESLANGKPRPIRTVVLPQLPEPAETVSMPDAAPVPELPEVTPAAPAPALPVPDQTPLRVAPLPVPRRYEAPSQRPDPSGTPMRSPVPVVLAMALEAPEFPGVSKPSTLDLAVPEMALPDGSTELEDPTVPQRQMADALSRSQPSMVAVGPAPSIPWPELEPDEIPEVASGLLEAPAATVPATSLAEGEIIVPATENPSAIALETPEFGAAETAVALDDAEADDEELPVVIDTGIAATEGQAVVELAEAPVAGDETPVVVGTGGTVPDDTGMVAGVDEAAEQKPEESPYIAPPEGDGIALSDEAPYDEEAPAEYIIQLEPAGPKPPVAAVAASDVPAAPAEDIAKAPAGGAAPAGNTGSASGPTGATGSGAVTTAQAGPSARGRALDSVMGSLSRGLYYIQIGAYTTELAASEAVAGLEAALPVVVQKTDNRGKPSWKVYVGPMSRDESGLALLRVKAMGFRDAFLKKGS